MAVDPDNEYLHQPDPPDLETFLGWIETDPKRAKLVLRMGLENEEEWALQLYSACVDKVGYFGVMVPPVSVKWCHFERCCNCS